MKLIAIICGLLLATLFAVPAVAAEADVYCQTITTGNGFAPASTTHPCPVTVSGVAVDPCQSNVKQYAPISQTANAKYISAATGKKNYICSIMIVTAAAENVSLVGGTGSVCGSNTEAVIGAATAANGPNLAANGGFSHGDGTSSIASGATANEDVCLFESGSDRIAGVLTYVQQ